MGNLVLTRKLGETIRVGDRVKITVLEVRSGQVKLGIDAPPEVKVHREEIWQRIQDELRKEQPVKPEHRANPPPAAADHTSNERRRSPWVLRLIMGGRPA